jgi:hypothetical protein
MISSDLPEWRISEAALERPVMITLKPNAPVAKLVYDLKPLKTLGVRYFLGPWSKVGSARFGAAKTDGIFPAGRVVIEGRVVRRDRLIPASLRRNQFGGRDGTRVTASRSAL